MVISRKYTVASRKMASRMLGTPGNLLVLGPLIVTKMIKNVKRSVVPRHGEEQDAKNIRAPGLESRMKGRTGNDRNTIKGELRRPLFLGNASIVHVQVHLRGWLY